ncbi:MAG: hypothetical protein JNL82_05145 [Myxococcales bacterium]|nr:hypothetical protein [Myxococcales bacterium]
MTHDPVRLLHDSAAGAALRRDLGAVARVDIPYDVSAGLARFETNLSKSAGVARAGGGSGGVIAGALLLAGGLAAAMLLWPGAERPSAPASASEPVAVVAPISAPSGAPAVADVPAPETAVALEPPPAAPAVVVPEEAAEFVDVDEAPTAARTGKRVVRPRPPATTDKQRAPAADYLREARNLQTARSLLGRDAARALELAEAGRAEFSGGTFKQEWEGVAILALFELGRPEARARGEAFLRSYPSGTYAPRVRQAMGE